MSSGRPGVSGDTSQECHRMVGTDLEPEMQSGSPDMSGERDKNDSDFVWA